MSELIPPLPELEIENYNKHLCDQETVDLALKIVHERRPDFFTKFAERERFNLDVKEIGSEFYTFLATAVSEQLDLPHLGSAAILLEARRRARLMYGIPLLPSATQPVHV